VGKATRRIDPFTVRKAQNHKGDELEQISAPAKVADAIEVFRESQELAKQFDEEASVYKEMVLEFAECEHAKRLATGIIRSFKIVGKGREVTFVVTDSSAGITEDEANAFAAKWGRAAADELIVNDFSSIRFDSAVLELNYDAVVHALQALPADVLEKLFKPMLKKSCAGAAEAARKYATQPAEFRELVQQLKLKSQLR
jgi:hypothetical protein